MQLATRTICEEVIHILGKCQEFDIFYVECRKDPPIAKNIFSFLKKQKKLTSNHRKLHV